MPVRRSSWLGLIAVIVSPLSTDVVSGQAAAKATLSPAVSCTQFLAPKREVNGQQIGQDDCKLREAVVVDDSWPEVATVLGLDQTKTYRRLEVGLSGSLDGYSVKEGPRIVTFTSAPDLVFPQAGNRTEPVRGVLRYDMALGASMAIMFPEGTGWNGKLFLTLPGMGSYRLGTIKTWDHNFNPGNPMGDLTKYEKVMLSKGFAVAKTRRNHNNERPGDGDYAVKLFDGTVLLDRNPADSPELIIGYAQVAQNIIADRLGRKPAQTYWYGHSGGGRLGRLVNYNNYRTRANTGADGQPIIDGLLVDDSGAGLYLPQVFRNGEDILFKTDVDKQDFVPTIEVAHQAYLNDRYDPVPDWVSTSFHLNKYKNAATLRAKGLWPKFRMYEVRGISHSGGESLPNQKREDQDILPMWRLMEGFVEMLDAWVDKGVAPPPTKSDWMELGDANKDGVNENEGVAMPELACPLGVYYPFPPSRGRDGGGTTAWVGFDGKGEEPFDGRFERGDGPPHLELTPYVDMNRNGFRDFRETVTQAWRRMGLLKPTESLSRARYAECTQSVVAKLRKDGFISEKVAAYYIEQAKTGTWPDWVR